MSYPVRFLVSFAIGLSLLGSPAQAQSPGVTVKVNETAFVRVDGQLKGIASTYSPLKISLLPGHYRVTAEALGGGGRFEQEVEVEAGSTIVVQAQLAPARAPLAISAGDDFPRKSVVDQATETRREQNRLEHQQQIRLLDSQLDNLQRQKAEWENLRSSAERHLQSNCQNDSGSTPSWVAAIKAAGCLAAQANRQRAESQLWRLQVDIDSKQREIQRLDRQLAF